MRGGGDGVGGEPGLEVGEGGVERGVGGRFDLLEVVRVAEFGMRGQKALERREPEFFGRLGDLDVRRDSVAVDELPLGRVIIRGRELQRLLGAGVELEERLHRSFAEGALADQRADAVLVDPGRHDLRRGGAARVDDHGERDVPDFARRLGDVGEVVFVGQAALCLEDELAPGQERLGDSAGLDDETAGVVPQVEHEAAGLGLEQRRQRAAEREQRLPLMRSLTRRVAAAEARIAQLEAEQATLVASLSDTEAKPDFEGVNRRLGQIQTELATVNALWEQAASELAFIEAE